MEYDDLKDLLESFDDPKTERQSRRAATRMAKNHRHPLPARFDVTIMGDRGLCRNSFRLWEDEDLDWVLAVDGYSDYSTKFKFRDAQQVKTVLTALLREIYRFTDGE